MALCDAELDSSSVLEENVARCVGIAIHLEVAVRIGTPEALGTAQLSMNGAAFPARLAGVLLRDDSNDAIGSLAAIQEELSKPVVAPREHLTHGLGSESAPPSFHHLTRFELR